jgi:hypothetical protein
VGFSAVFSAVVFMALAWLRGLRAHIGKSPGASLIPTGPDQGRLRDVPDSQVRVPGP